VQKNCLLCASNLLNLGHLILQQQRLFIPSKWQFCLKDAKRQWQKILIHLIPAEYAVFPFVPVLIVGIVLLILLFLLIAYVVYKKHNKRISNRSTGQTQVLPHVPSTPKVHEVDPSKMKNKSEMPDEDDMISPYGAISYRQSDAETTESTWTNGLKRKMMFKVFKRVSW